jgi:hypothetical protein
MLLLQIRENVNARIDTNEHQMVIIVKQYKITKHLRSFAKNNFDKIPIVMELKILMGDINALVILDINETATKHPV